MSISGFYGTVIHCSKIKKISKCNNNKSIHVANQRLCIDHLVIHTVYVQSSLDFDKKYFIHSHTCTCRVYH